MCSEKRGRDRRKETEWEIVTERRRRRRRDRRLSLLDLCVHYGMPSIPPSVRGRRHGNSCSSVTAETREMLDIKKWLIPTRLCWFILCVCVWQVCCFIFMITDIFPGVKCEQGGNILTEGHVFLEGFFSDLFWRSKYSVTSRAVRDVQLPPWFSAGTVGSRQEHPAETRYNKSVKKAWS